MNLLRDLPLLRLWRRLAAGRRTVRPVYTVTVPASLAEVGLIDLRRPVVVAPPAPLPRVAER